MVVNICAHISYSKLARTAPLKCISCFVIYRVPDIDMIPFKVLIFPN
jgi:hypothetical protein